MRQVEERHKASKGRQENRQNIDSENRETFKLGTEPDDVLVGLGGCRLKRWKKPRG